MESTTDFLNWTSAFIGSVVIFGLGWGAHMLYLRKGGKAWAKRMEREAKAFISKKI